jgi:ABC-2 type transport system ATP-binding protein
VGLDLDQGVFRSWQGTDSLLVELLGGRPGRAGRAGELSRQSLDLSGQLRMAVDRFEGVRAIPFEVIAGLALLYIACLYPLEWWVVSRGGRPWVAWLTLPAVVALFAGLAWWTADRWKGDGWRSRRADVVDIDLASSMARGTSFFGAWSPVNAFVDVAAVPSTTAIGADPPASVVSWFGAGGRGIGAVDCPTAHPSLATEPYLAVAGLEGLDGVPIAASSSRLFEAEWLGPVTEAALVSTLRQDAQGTLSGTLDSRLPFALEQCALFHAGWYYDVGTLAPGARFDPESGKGPRTLASALTRSATVYDRTQTERWRVDDTDVDRILEVAGFHAAAGGASYTSLEAGRLGRIDLSPLLPIGRAVLVGRGPAGTAWSCLEGRSTSAAGAAGTPTAGDAPAMWRIVIPREKQPMIETIDLTKKYGDFSALEALDLKLEKGDLFGFIGPNGAGKTTTIRILATLLSPTWGEAYVCGHSIYTHPREIRRAIGYMPDIFGVYDDMRVIEYLEFFAAAYRIAGPQRRRVAERSLELVDLTVKRDELVTSLSRGMTQRLGLARVLLHDPQVLLLDEPASGLDPRARIEMRGLLKRLQGLGKTILVSSHILPELADICNRVGIIEYGRLLACGDVQDLLAQVRGRPVIRIRVAGPAEPAAKIVEGSPEADKVTVRDGEVLVTLKPGCDDPSGLAARLVAEGFRLLSMRESEVNLETAFLEITRGSLGRPSDDSAAAPEPAS